MDRDTCVSNYRTFWFGVCSCSSDGWELRLIKEAIWVQALDAAFAHYDADMQKRSTRSGERPNGFV